MINPFDLAPLELTDEAEHDKRLWEVVISGLKGREKKIQMEAFVNRYHEMPRYMATVQPSIRTER